MARIDINGKFLGAGLNGVHRTAAHYASLLIERGRAAGHEVRLLSPREVAPDPEFPLLRPEVHPGRFGAGQGWEMLTLPRLARGALLVNFCNLAPLLHPRSMVMIHDAQTYLYPADYSGRQATAYRALLPLIGRRALRILTVSDFSRHSLADHHVGRLDKIDVVHNGTDHIRDIPPEPEILAQHGLEAGGYVMVVGSAKGYKNIARVFEAMRTPLPGGQKLVVAGGAGRDAYLAKGWQPPEGTVFTGFVSDGALRALYEGAAVFAFPSRTEGFGLPPIEAMHCGTPVVAARAGAMPEVCAEGALLVDPEDTAAWRDALISVLGDPARSDALRLKGSERAAQLSWRAAGDRLWETVSKVI
ncbi:glycosyltransferase family 4 protein [Salipiger bermudensis]|uniref:glycosyltransferase family 4 protein n=1 Tax=Salipiger bermudensis TaxID=344736 RepID=UPI001C99DDFA|nr:glycosyltransferase family 1 protein [Salipiger bermudensis]MBY6005208.1 glycosyltransferase family 4 protein [Salipiger bermudensis]